MKKIKKQKSLFSLKELNAIDCLELPQESHEYVHGGGGWLSVELMECTKESFHHFLEHPIGPAARAIGLGLPGAYAFIKGSYHLVSTVGQGVKYCADYYIPTLRGREQANIEMVNPQPTNNVQNVFPSPHTNNPNPNTEEHSTLIQRRIQPSSPGRIRPRNADFAINTADIEIRRPSNVVASNPSENNARQNAWNKLIKTAKAAGGYLTFGTASLHLAGDIIYNEIFGIRFCKLAIESCKKGFLSYVYVDVKGSERTYPCLENNEKMAQEIMSLNCKIVTGGGKGQYIHEFLPGKPVVEYTCKDGKPVII